MTDLKCPLYEWCVGRCHDCLGLPIDSTELEPPQIEQLIEEAIACWEDQIQ